MLPVKCVSLSLHSLLVVMRPLLHCVVDLCHPVALPAQPDFLERRITTDINTLGVVMEAFKKSQSCIIRVLDFD